MKKTKAAEKERMQAIISILSEIYPNVKIQLNYSEPFELLVATILSAQCTDARVNMVTEELFKKYRKIEDFATVATEELEQDIFSTGFYRAKARNIIATANQILEEFQGEVPNNMNDLLKLHGVGRKTANVILGHCFDTPGIVVDTHVIRLSNRMGFVGTKDAVKIEFALMELIAENQWVSFTHYFINLGRKICTARSPNCPNCPIEQLCPKKIK